MAGMKSRTEILLSMVAAFHHVSLGLKSLPEELRLTRDESNLGIKILEEEYNGDLQAASAALAEDPMLSSLVDF